MNNKLLFAVAMTVLASSVSFAESVSGYYRANGTYVNGYERSDRNSTVTDNYSFKGNTNPYTGSEGTNSYKHDTTSPYYNGTTDSQGKTGHSNSNLGSWGN